MTSICVYCRQEFTPKVREQIYCSTECRKQQYALRGPVLRVVNDERECVECKRAFLARSVGQKFCDKLCYKAYYDKIKLEKKERNTCVICGNSFIPRIKTQIICGKPCRGIYISRQQKEKYRQKVEIIKKAESENNVDEIPVVGKKSRTSTNTSFVNFDVLRLYNEEEFEEWFAHNYIMFGISKIIKIDRMFPDVIAQAFSGNLLRIELEFSAINFIAHDHIPGNCDLIISYVKGPRITSVRGVPVIAVFEVPGLVRGLTNMDHNKAVLTPYFKNLTIFFARHLQYFLANNESYDTAKQADYEKLYRSLLNSRSDGKG